MKKLLQIITFVFFIFILSGCSTTGIDPQNLISPPKANMDQQAIHDLLKTADGEINFVYPKRGEYRSAVIMHSIDHMKSELAVAFSQDPSGGIYIQLIGKENDDWKIINRFKNTGIQVDKVEFGDLDGDGIDEIIVGWGSPQSLTATISVYRASEMGFTEYNIEKSYSEFILTDFANDDIKEIFVATTFTQPESQDDQSENATAYLYEYSGGIKLKSICNLNNAVVVYSQCVETKISQNEKAVVLEGVLAEGSTVTQIISGSGIYLGAPLSYDSNLKLYNNFTRPSSLQELARDINNDGIIEFPKLVLQSPFDMNSETDIVNYYVDWVQLDDGLRDFRTIERTVMDSENNFMFTIDEEYKMICSKVLPNEYTVSEIVHYESSDTTTIKTWLTIKIFDIEDWKVAKDYEYLYKGSNDKIYAVKAVEIKDGQEKIDRLVDSIRPID